ncbi:MAG: SemiSWEET transporter [Candidatus Woesearchaeota archaeon]
MIGLIAASLTSFAGLPQLLKILKTKHTKDLSLEMYTMMFIGVLLWLVYGILKKDLALILANLVSGIIVGLIWVLKIKYK